MWNKIEFSKKELNQILISYQSGESLRRTALVTGYSPSVIKRVLKENSFKIRPQFPDISDKQASEITNRYKKNETLKGIAKDLARSPKLVRRTLTNSGCKIRSMSEVRVLAQINKPNAKKYVIDDTAFSKITEESAYWIGFLMADGSVRKTNQVQLLLAELDTNHIEKFRDFLKSNHPIKTRICKGGGICGSLDKNKNPFKNSTLVVISRQICQDLARFGVVPQKTAIAKVYKLENNRHFWRGLIDGDGSVGFYKQKSGNSWINTATISLTGSKDIVEQFLCFVNSIVKTRVKIRPLVSSKVAYTVKLTGQIACKIILTLYKKPSIYLHRKYEKALEVFKRYDSIQHNKDKRVSKIGIAVSLYEKGISVKEIANQLGYSTSNIYYHFKNLKIAKLLRKRKEPTWIRYRKEGKCKDCRATAAPNKSRCEFHLQKARDYWRNKHPKTLEKN